jgi:DNA mismatch repair protein MutS
VILDEIGRGTSTYDGLSIAWAVVEYLHENPRRRARTLFATHYHELAELEGRMARIRNYNVAVREANDAITFLYQIIPGSADRSYGIYAAQLAGMPQETLERAREILFQLECKSRTPEEGSEAGSGGSPLPALFDRPAATQDIDVMQLDLFAPALPPIFEKLSELDVSHLTPMQALQILDELVRRLRN